MSETLRSQWCRLDLTALPRGVVAVDATRNAWPLWQGPIASVLEELTEKLPIESHPVVAFLGDRRTHSLKDILLALSAGSSAVPLDIAGQLGRYPVLGPLLWELAHEPARPLLVITNTPLLDMEDWAIPEITKRTLIYRITGEQRGSGMAFREVGPEADLSILVEHLRNPIQSVRVNHSTALATTWDNDAYHDEIGSLKWQAGASPGLTACFTLPENCHLTAEVVRADGAVHSVPFIDAEPLAEPPAVALTSAEGNVFNLWRRGTPFWCSHCSRSHPPGQLVCGERAPGVGLFPSLLEPCLAYRAHFRAGDWALTPLPRGRLALADSSVIVIQGENRARYSFEQDEWIASEMDTNRFLPLEGGDYLLHPVCAR